MNKAVFELSERLRHASDIGAKLDAIEQETKEEHEREEASFKKKLLGGYHAISTVGVQIEDLKTALNDFKTAETRAASVLHSATGLVRDHAAVRAVVSAHERFATVRWFIENLQAAEEDVPRGELETFHNTVYAKEEFLCELERFKGYKMSPTDRTKVTAVTAAITRLSSECTAVLVEIADDVLGNIAEIPALNRIVAREEARDALTKQVQSDSVYAALHPRYINRRPKGLQAALIGALRSSISARFSAIDTGAGFVGRLDFVLEELGNIRSKVLLDFFDFDSFLAVYHTSLVSLVVGALNRLDPGEILALIEFKSRYHKKIADDFERVPDALTPPLIPDETSLLDRYAAAAVSRLGIWIDNITAAEIEKFTTRDGGLTRDADGKLVAPGFVALLQLIKTQLEPVAFSRPVFRTVTEAVRRHCDTFRSKIIGAVEKELPDAIKGKGRPGFEDYVIMFANSGLRLTQYITSLPQCQAPEVRELGNTFMGILRSCNHILAELVLSTCGPVIRRLFTNDAEGTTRVLVITLEDFLADYARLMDEYAFAAFVGELCAALVGAYAKRLRAKKAVLGSSAGVALRSDHVALLDLLGPRADREQVEGALRPLLRAVPLVESASEDLIIAEVRSLRLMRSAFDRDTMVFIAEKRTDLAEDARRRLISGIKEIFSDKPSKKKTFISKFLS